MGETPIMESKYSINMEELNENTAIRIILRQIKPGSTVLECGCASGYMTRYMKEKLGAKVSIIELNPSDYDRAKEYAVDGVCADLEGGEWSGFFQGRTFDLILFADVLEHLHDPEDVLKRAVDLLKEDGTIIASIPNIAHADILINLLNGRFNYMPLGLLDNTHIHFWAQKNLDALFQQAGLSIVERDYAILPPYWTEQKSKDETEGLLPAIYTLCHQPFADVYEFVYCAKKTAYVRERGLACTDHYAERHLAYWIEPPCCSKYQEEQNRLAAQHTEQKRLIQDQQTHIAQLAAQIISLGESLVQQQTHIEKLAEQNVSLGENLGQQQSCNAQLEAHNRELNMELKQQRTYIEQLQEQNRYYKESFDTISNATFWKITKPFRVILDTLKSVFCSGKGAKDLGDTAEAVERQPQVQTAKDVFYSVGDPMTVLCTRHTLFVARLAAHALEKLGIRTTILTEEPETYSDELHIVICPQMFQRMPGRYIAFQMEQTVSSRWLTDEYYDRLDRAYAIFDYSLVNVAFFRETSSSGKNIYYLPIDYLPSLKRPHKRYQYDVLFYGDANCPRRQRILAELQQRFSVKVVSEVFGEELYQLLGRARVVVNIHYYDNAMLETTRLYEVLSLGRSLVVSERSSDGEEEKRLEGIVDFVAVDDTDALADRIEYWLSHEAERAEAVKRNNRTLAGRANAFDFFFYRFMLAQDWMSFDRFYELAGDFVTFRGDRICLSLPETGERRRAFDRDNRYGFEVIPGLRHKRGWTGCGLSYKYIMKRAKDQGLEQILVCEDDVLFPDDFAARWEKCLKYLREHPDFDIFQGFMADVRDVTIRRVDRMYGETIVHLDHMISMVFNYYRSSVYDDLIHWDETDPDMEHNTIDRALEAMDLNIVTTVPFLVGHKEDLDSAAWDFNNSHYRDQIEKSKKKLVNLIRECADPVISQSWIESLKEKPIISVIIAAKRLEERGPYLEKALDSLCGQLYQGFEALVVADPTDIDCVNGIVERYVNRITIRAVPLEQETADIWTYWCKGVSLSHGSLIGFLEQEETLTPNCLAYVLEAVNETTVRKWKLYLIPDDAVTEDGELLNEDWKEGAGSQAGGVESLLHFGVFKKECFHEDYSAFENWLLSLGREDLFISPWIGCHCVAIKDVWDKSRVRCLAFYLPQFHEIPENNEWWGKGFTEWVNVKKAKPLYPGHDQPRIPGELGYYDLSGPEGLEIQRKQIKLAKEYGVSGFCYYCYWFDNGKRLLEMPLDRHLHDKTLDFPFCICWANENWTRRWDGGNSEILMPQSYAPGWAERFILDMLPYLKDERYIRVNGAPYLLIYQLKDIPQPYKVINTWRSVARSNGIERLHISAVRWTPDTSELMLSGYALDSLTDFPPHLVRLNGTDHDEEKKFGLGRGQVNDYRKACKYHMEMPKQNYTYFRTVMLEWDNTARKGKDAVLFEDFSFTSFKKWLYSAKRYVLRQNRPGEDLVFINAWNEWAEGTYLEPSEPLGRTALESTKEALGWR